MLVKSKFSARPLAFLLTAFALTFGSNALAEQPSVGASANNGVVKGAQLPVLRSILGRNGDARPAERSSRVAPSYGSNANTNSNAARSVAQGSVRIREKNSTETPQVEVTYTNSAASQVGENAPQNDEPILLEDVELELPAENVPAADDNAADAAVNAESNADANDAPAGSEETAPQIEQSTAAQDDEDARALEERQQAATEAQGAEVPAEVKSRALTSDDEDAPDARVRLTELDVTEEAVAEHTQETAPAEIQKQIEVPEVSAKPALGFADSAKAVRDMSSDLLEQLKAHNGAELYARWRAYNASIRSRTNSLQTGNELNNRARLSWYEKLYQDPLNSVNEMESSSRAWAEDFMGSAADVVEGVRLARVRMDVSRRNERKPQSSADSTDAIDMLKAALVEAASLHAKAVAPLSKNDLAAIVNEAYSIFCGQVQSGHTIPSRGRGQYLVDAMEKMNKGALYEAGETVLSLLDEKTLAALANIDFDKLEKTRIGDNQIVGLIPTEAGDILVGDKNRTVWDLDKYPKACCVIDLGGDDVYREGACVLARPLLVVLDFGKGGDEYVGKNYAIQAGSVLGVTMWYDDGGHDTYLAKDICQGSTIGGFAVLVNEGGNDKYMGFRRAQGAALGGFAALIDRGGNDDYRAALLAQGFGAPGGFGAIVDKSGDDHYYVGGYFFDSYPEHPGYDGWGQGIGAGIRRCACGGIGLLLDGDGDDAYEFDYFGHGGGYWMGVGIARDFGGNDVRYAATSTMYDGSRRREQRWTRFTNGFGCHYAIGACFDDKGDDVYGGTIMGLGMGWDLGAGFLIDFEGDDVFEATGGLTQGAGGEGSIGAILNYRGDDTYYGNYQGYASGQLSYHAPSNCGANFSFVVDHGGKDTYGGTDNSRRLIQNNSITVRGYSTGLVIDRPSPNEERDSQAAIARSGQAAQAQAGQTAQRQGAQPRQQQAQQQPKKAQVTTAGYKTAEKNLKTMVEPPPLYDTNPHPTTSGSNAFNPQPDMGGYSGGSTGGWGGGGGLFGRGGLF